MATSDLVLPSDAGAAGDGGDLLTLPSDRAELTLPSDRVADTWGPEVPRMRAGSSEGVVGRMVRAGMEGLSPFIGLPEDEAARRDLLVGDNYMGSDIERQGLFPAITKPFVPLPAIGEEGVKRMAAAPQTGAWAPLEAQTRENREKGAANVAALWNTAKGFIEFAESPLGLATMGAGAAATKLGLPAIKALLSAAYAADIARQTPAAARQAGELSVTGTPLEQANANVGLASTIALPAMLGKHAASETRAAIIEVRNPKALPDAKDAEPSTSTATPEPPATQRAQAEATEQPKAPATSSLETDPDDVRFPDGTVDPIETALNRMRRAGREPVEAPEGAADVETAPAQTDAAGAAPATKADVIDLAGQLEDLQKSLGNPFKGPEIANSPLPIAESVPAPAPVEAVAAKSSGRAKPSFWYRERSDGVPDIIDDIQTLGGIRTPGDIAGEEYDAYPDTRRVAPLLFRKNAVHRPDTMIQELRSLGGVGNFEGSSWKRIETADDLFAAIRSAMREREKLRQTGGGAEAQADRFWSAVGQPENAKGVEKITADQLAVGQKFRVKFPGASHEELTVQHVDAVSGEVTVKDGPKFGVQDLPAGAEIYIKKGTLQQSDKATTQPAKDSYDSLVKAAYLATEANRRLNDLRPVVLSDVMEFAKSGQPATEKAVTDWLESRGVTGAVDSHVAEIIKYQKDARAVEAGNAANQRLAQWKFAAGETVDTAGRLREGAKPIDSSAADGVASMYGIQPDKLNEGGKKQQAYQTDFLDLQPARGQVAGAGNWESSADTGRQQRDAAGTALTTLATGDLDAAFKHGNVVSSIDPKAAPHELPQYRVNGTRIITPEDFAKTLVALRSPFSESLKIAIVDMDGKVVHSQVLYAGTLDSISVDARDFLRLAQKFKDQGKRMFISHNHPSGDPSPSTADLAFQTKLDGFTKNAGFEIVDHVITNGRHYYSMRSGRMERLSDEVLATWENVARYNLQTVDNNIAMQRLVASLRQTNKDVAHVIYLNTPSKVTAIERVPVELGQIMNAATQGVAREAAKSIIVDFGPNVPALVAHHWVSSINLSLFGSDTRIVDFSCHGVDSGHAAGYTMLEGGDFKFDAPESVGGQKARQAQELRIEAERKAKAGMLDRAGKRLQGSDLDTTGEMFGSEVKVDKAEQSSLFEEGPEYAKDKPERERTTDQVKADIVAADADLKAKLRAHQRPEERVGKSKEEARQDYSLAAARLNTLKDELYHHPDYIAEQLARHHAALTEANAMLEPHGLRVQPDIYPDPNRLEAVLTPEQLARYHELSNVIGSSTTELGRMPKGMISRVYGEMQKDGRLPKTAPLLPNAGRTLDSLTEWMRENGVDSPRMSLMERLNLGGRVGEAVEGAKTSWQKTWLKLQGIWRATVESYKSPPLDDDFRHVIKSWIYADQRTGLETHRFIKDLVAEVPNSLRRKAIAVWLDAGGDVGLLRMQASAVPDAYRTIWDTATRLTAGEQELGRKIKADFEAKLEDALNVGLIEKGREDYGVPQRWKIAPEGLPNPDGKRQTAGRPNAKLDPRDPFFALQRTVPSYFEGILAGGVPESLDIAHLVPVYHAAFHKTLSSRGMIAALCDATAKDGRPVVKLSGKASTVTSSDGGRAYFVDSKARDRSDVSEDGRPYQSLDHSALKGWKVAFKDEAGNPIMVKGDMLIHPDHYTYLKNELGRSGLRDDMAGKLMGPILNSQAFLKASKLSASAFHLMTIGEHMASHLVNPFLNGFRIDLRQADQSLLVRNGLELGMGHPQQMYSEGLASAHSGLFNMISGLGDLSAKMTDWIFKDYIPTIMMKAGLHALENNRKRYSKATREGKALTENQVAELTAQQMNAAGGLLNYRMRGAEGNFWGKLGANKTLMDLQRLALMAPQFLEARARVVGQALKPYGHEQRKMLILQAGILYVGCRVLNQMLDGDPHWDDNPFSVVINGRAYSIRTIVGDFWHAMTDPKSFLAGRLSPFARMGIEDLVTGRDLRTGARKEPPIQTEWVPGRAAQNVVVDVANWLTPIPFDGILPGSTGREQTAVGMALSSVGVGSRKWTASQQIYDLAAAFNRDSKDPATRNWQLSKEGGAWSVSPYRKLDSLLDAGDLEKARREVTELEVDGRTREQIMRRYHRATYFTGSKARETQFKAGLSARAQQLYQGALAEREARRVALSQAMR